MKSRFTVPEYYSGAVKADVISLDKKEEVDVGLNAISMNKRV